VEPRFRTDHMNKLSTWVLSVLCTLVLAGCAVPQPRRPAAGTADAA